MRKCAEKAPLNWCSFEVVRFDAKGCIRFRAGAVKDFGGKLFAIPKSTGDLTRIENVPDVAKSELMRQAVRLSITHQTFQEITYPPYHVQKSLHLIRREIYCQY